MDTFRKLLICCVLLAGLALPVSADDWGSGLSPMPPFSFDRDLGVDAVMRRLAEDSDGKTLTVKKSEREWVKSLFERGSPTVYGAEGLDYIGMPIGGITCGQLYLGGDGKLWHWDVFNTKRPTRVVQAYQFPTRQNSPLKQGFAIRTTYGGKTRVRPLDRNGFSDITFTGQYPIGYVEYEDPDSPVSVALEAFSPFIPLNVADSSFPATIMQFTVKNAGDRPVKMELAGWLENFVCKEKTTAALGERRNEIEHEPGFTFLNCTVGAVKSPESRKARPDVVFDDFEDGTYDNWRIEGDAFGKPGDLIRRYFHHQPLRGFRGNHLADSFRNAGKPGASAQSSDGYRGKLASKPFRIERRSITFLVGGGPHQDTCIRLLLGGEVVRTASGNQSETLVSKGWDVSGLESKEAIIEIVDDNTRGWGHVMVDEIIFTDKPPLTMSSLEEQPDFGTMGLSLLGPPQGGFALADVAPESLPDAVFASGAGDSPVAAKPLDTTLVGALGRRITLKPGESARVTFVVS